MPDETTLVRFRQRLVQYGQQEKLLGLVNRQLEHKGLILKTCTLVDATLLQAARRAPAKTDPTSGDGDAGYTVKRGQPHYGYKAHVAVDQTHTLIRHVTLTSASVHDSQEFETVVKGDEEMVTADKAYWSRARSEWCGRNGVANGILRKPSRGEKLRASAVRANRLFSSIRCQIEKVFGWWKRSAGYRRVRYVGHETQPAGVGVQKHLLEPQTAGQPESHMKRTVRRARQRGKKIESGTKKFRHHTDDRPHFS